MSGVTGVVLVGGFGTRLRPVTYSVPKQLIPVAGRPILYHALDLLPPEVDRIVLACGYKSEVFESYLRAHPYPRPVKLVRETTPLGTGGGLKNVALEATDPFYLLNGDVIAGFDLEPLSQTLGTEGGLGIMGFVEVEDPSPYGVARFDPSGRIVEFVDETPPGIRPQPVDQCRGLPLASGDARDHPGRGSPSAWRRRSSRACCPGRSSGCATVPGGR
ncbi:Nucleotidyl transferase, partial [mine drainage metagenome]